MHLFATLFALIVLSSTAVAQVKKPEPPAVRVPIERSLQAIVVTTTNWTDIKGEARLFERRSPQSDWKPVGDAFPVVVGRNGLAASAEPAPYGLEGITPVKAEGDGKAPAGLFPLAFAFGSGERPDGTRLTYLKLVESTECVDDVRSSFYNRVVDRYKVGNFDWKSSEKMLAVGDEYSLGVFVAYNSYPVVKASGSCIFLHVWRDSETGTAGCTAMARDNIKKVLVWLDPKKNPYLIQMPLAVYDQVGSRSNLPRLR